MTLVHQDVGVEPCMHALVVGCGRFPFMPNPAQVARQACYDSAVEMVRFLLEHQDSLLPRLGSVACLLADPQVAAGEGLDRLPAGLPTIGQAVPVASPEQENVNDALNDLLGRCRPGDSLFLYFCSHGVAGRDETGLLVLEDVHRNAGNPWRQMLDVKYLAQVLPVRSGAASVWVFLDACQEVLPELKDQAGGVQLAAPIVAGVTEISRCPVVSATLSAGRYGTATHAPPEGGTAYFTRALIEGMTRCCVERRQQEWRVTAMRIMFGLENVARAVDGTMIETGPLLPFNKEAQLLRVDQPSIPVHVTSLPEAFLEGAADVRLLDEEHQVVATKPPGPEWRFRIDRIPSAYTVRVSRDGVNQDTHLDVDAPAAILEVQEQ